jgi:hypothetical protein
MLTRSEDHREQVKECERIFVSWQWGMAFIAALIVIIAGITFAGGSKIGSFEQQLWDGKVQQEKYTTEANAARQDINKKLDLLIELSKHNQKQLR